MVATINIPNSSTQFDLYRSSRRWVDVKNRVKNALKRHAPIGFAQRESLLMGCETDRDQSTARQI